MDIHSFARHLYTQDYERFLACRFARAPLQPALFALLSFNVEIAKIPDMVSEPMLGHIRYAWWREALDEVYNGSPVRKHEVTIPLAEVITEFELPRADFDAVIDAREAQFAAGNMATIEEFLSYCDATSTSLLRLIAGVLHNREELRELGIAWAAVGLLRSAGHQMRTNRVLLPLGEDWEALPALAKDVCERVGGIQKAKFKHPVFRAMHIMVTHHLQRLKKLGYNPLDPRWQQRSGWLYWKLMWV